MGIAAGQIRTLSVTVNKTHDRVTVSGITTIINYSRIVHSWGSELHVEAFPAKIAYLITSISRHEIDVILSQV